MNLAVLRGMWAAASILVALTQTGCGGGGAGASQQQSAPPPVATAAGTSSGEASGAAVGAAGGSVTSSDGKFTLTIPAGALQETRTISIQPITNQAHGGSGPAFRLSPEGQTFSKPVTLSFNYSDADVNGSAPSALGVAFQRPDGTWEWVANPQVDTVARRVTIETPDAKEHPEIKRFPGFHVDAAKANDYNEFAFATKGLDGSNEPAGGGELRAGKYWRIVYCLNEEARRPSIIELVRNYENAFKKVGGAMISRYPRGGEPEVAVFKIQQPAASERWVQLHVFNEGGCYQLDVVDVAGMTQKVEFSAGEMADAIKKNGFIALTGILFDTGKDTLRPESTPLLNEVAALLKKDTALKVSVVGHTDNVGAKASNLELSRKRAERVVKFLTDNGIDAKRLNFAGKGDTAPVADNRTEAGRAKNRRVELVKS